MKDAAAAGPRRTVRRVMTGLAAVSLLAEVVVLVRRRGSLFEVDTVVRCTRGHLFTTWWIPGGSLKALRLGWWRYQYCPVCASWRLVTPATASRLSVVERAEAATAHDRRIP